MKGWGIFFVVLGALNLIAFSVGIFSGTPKGWLVGHYVCGVGFIILGILLVYRAEKNIDKNKQEKINKDNWLK